LFTQNQKLFIRFLCNISINYGAIGDKMSKIRFLLMNLTRPKLFSLILHRLFIIDPEGIVQGYEVLTPQVGRNVSEALRQIQAFQLVRDSKGTEATLSGWQPGKPTLKPGPDLVGNVWEVWETDMAF